jgi:hypothetical protein
MQVQSTAAQTLRAPSILIGLDAGDSIKLSNREISLAYFGSSSNFIFATVSKNSLNGAGQKLHSMSGEVAIFFLQTRKLLVSPCVAD